MPFQFSWLCELLEELHKNQYKRCIKSARNQSYEHQIIFNWYQRFSHKIKRTGPSGIAFLSCLFPERRPDRVYGLQAKRLSHIFGRSLGLGATRAAELNAWRNQDGADFATCVEQVLRQCENTAPSSGKEVTLEELNEVLDLVAAHAPSSSPAIRARLSDANPTELLTPILRRLKSHEAKWFARMLLKTYAPVQIPEHEAMRGFHFMLPTLLALQNSFEAATATLAKNSIAQLPPRPDKNFEHAILPLLTDHVQPRLGVMIRRQPYYKGRSIKNCCNLAAGRQMSIERKYDGEYCQVHIDISKGYDCLQIFSKSGRDSTTDRIRLHGVIKDALRIERNGTKIKKHCIVEGELLVWSSSHEQIQPFHKIRRHVKHGGREIGTARDSPMKSDEHLMIAFYDILVLDDLMLLNEPHKVRRQYLKAILQTTEGRAVLCERTVIDFRTKGAAHKLRATFAKAITNRWEGLILKGLNEPYFSWNTQNHGIKLKKDYITGLGDIADLCIVGGRRDPHAELQIGLGPLQWTSFYVGAVTNMEALQRFNAKPQIVIIDTLTHFSMPNTELLDLNQLGRLMQVDFDHSITQFDTKMGRFDLEAPTHLFKKPFVVEIMGAGFEKLSNCSFFTLRFPRKTDGKVKLHTDRTLVDTTSFAELQDIAGRSIAAPEDHESQEDVRWIERLTKADGKRQRSETVSQQTTSSRTPKSASAISLSPLSYAPRMSHQIFVRPDTEEPETQVSRCTEVSLSTTNDMSLRSPTAQYSQTIHHHEIKRKSEVLEVASNQHSELKRRCLNNLSIQHKSRNISNLYERDDSIHRPPTTMTSIVRRHQYYRKNNIIHKAIADKLESIDEPRTVKTIPEIADTRQNNNVSRATGSALPSNTCTSGKVNLGHMGKDLACSPTKVQTYKQLSIKHRTNEVIQHNQLPTQLTSQLPTLAVSSPASMRKRGSGQLHFVSNGGPLQQSPKQSPQQTAAMINTVAQVPVQDQAPTEPYSVSQLDGATCTNTIQPYQNPKTPATVPCSPILVLDHQFQHDTDLLNIDADFVFSITRFLRYIDATLSDFTGTHTLPKYHIIIIDSLHPHQAANHFECFAHKVQSHILTTNPDQSLVQSLQKYNDTILAFDHRIFKHARIAGNKGRLDYDVLRSMQYEDGRGEDAAFFCGVLKFYEMDIENRSKVDTLKVGIELEYRFEWTTS